MTRARSAAFGACVCLSVLFGVQHSACQAGETDIRAADVAVVGENAAVDPFARLRGVMPSPRSAYWEQVGQGLQRLATLDGAAYNSEFGVLTLFGKPADSYGPFHVDDLMVALKAAYFETESLGVTIDPDPKDLHGPEMAVRYFGGCQDTALGWLMFECDRLLKSLSHGEDNITHAELRPEIPGFLNMLELSQEFAAKEAGEWNRFWLAFDLDEAPNWRQQTQQSNATQPIVHETGDGMAISFARCRMYLRTEVMVFENGEMTSAKGASSTAARRFADHFTANFDAFAARCREFDRLRALGRIMVLADWIEKSRVPIDLEYVRDYPQRVDIRTPHLTPAGKATLERVTRTTDRIATEIVSVFGGVDLNPRTYYAADSEGRAAAYRGLSAKEVRQHRSAVSWGTSLDGQPLVAVVVPTNATNLTKPNTRSNKRAALRSLRNEGEHPEGRVPEPIDLAARAERGEHVPIVSLATIDRYRQDRLGPTSAGVPLLVDTRYVSDREVSTPLPPETPQVAEQKDASPPRIRPPPQAGSEPAADTAGVTDLTPHAERGEAVGVVRQPLPKKEPRPAAQARAPPADGQFVPQASRPERTAAVKAALKDAERLESPQERMLAEPRAPPIQSEFAVLAERSEAVGIVTRRLTELRAADDETPWGLPIFATRGGQPTFNLPHLFQYESPRGGTVTRIEDMPTTKMRIADQLVVRSPLGDIHVSFAEPQIDQRRRAFFYPPKPSGAFAIVGFYPESRTLEFTDGMQVVFDTRGYAVQLQMPNGDSLAFRYPSAEMPWAEPVICSVTCAPGRVGTGVFRLVALTSRAAQPSPTRVNPEASRSSTPATAAVAIESPSGDAGAADVPSSAVAGGQSPEPAMSGDVPEEAEHEADSPSFKISVESRPSGGLLTQITEAPVLAVGEPAHLGPPFAFRVTNSDGTWIARLRSRFTAKDTYASPDWNGDTLSVHDLESGLLRVSLDCTEGEFRRDEAQALQLVATALSSSTAQSPAAGCVEFYIDIVLRSARVGGVVEDRLSYPVRVDLQRAKRGEGVAEFAVVGGALLVACGLCYCVYRRWT